ncbi:hypothetical protein ABEU19_002203 [Prescottella soli]|uniref:Uncharacterized protein n=1 Tax=Prescottella soli TaxID=1543852 RepID=A0ABW9FT00_9NOCA
MGATLVVVAGAFDVDSAGAFVVVVVAGDCDVDAAGAFVVVAGDFDVGAGDFDVGAELCSVVEGELSAVCVGAGVVVVPLGFAEATGAMENEVMTSAKTAKIIPSAAHRDTTSSPARRRKTRLRMKNTSRTTTTWSIARLTRGSATDHGKTDKHLIYTRGRHAS